MQKNTFAFVLAPEHLIYCFFKSTLNALSETLYISNFINTI